MMRRHRPRAGLVTRGVAALGIAALVAMPLAPEPEAQSPPTATRDVALSSVTVPPGGLITSFVGNQFRYCSIICPLVFQTVVTAAVTTLQTPVTFLASLQSGDLLRAIGAAAASVTGPTNAAAQAAILADGARVAPRALNAFEVGVVGLLDVIPAAADGLPGIVRALHAAREDTFAALNAPIVPNPSPTVTPEGVLQVAVVEAINVGAAIIFPAFNHVLSAVFDAPDAVARELAATGDLVRAVAAGFTTVARHLIAAGTVVAESVVTAVHNIGAAVEESRPTHKTTATPLTAPVEDAQDSPGRPDPTSDRDATEKPETTPTATDEPSRRSTTTTHDDTESAGAETESETETETETETSVVRDADDATETDGSPDQRPDRRSESADSAETSSEA